MKTKTTNTRQIVLDTETTGLSPEQGHRVIEIGAVELINRRPTGNHFHEYINPEREVEAEALAVHGISNEFLQDKPVFKDLIDRFVDYIDGAELIIHNAPFDVGFLNHEFKLVSPKYNKIAKYCTVFDTLKFAREKHPGQRNSLDALCKRYDINNSDRVLHGALLDAKILADLYLVMTGGQISLFGDDDQTQHVSHQNKTQFTIKRDGNFKVIRATAEELALHDGFFTD